MDAIPEYLNAEFFTSALEQTLVNKVQIQDLMVKRVEIKEGYCSDIYRVTVTYTTANDSELKIEKLLVKELFENLTENSREHLMYAVMLPGLHALLREAGIENQLAPKVYYTLKVSRESHLFEDLNHKGYEKYDRLVGFNVAQIRAIFKKIGYFHAASMIYKQKYPNVVASMKGFFCASDANLMAFTQKQVDENTKFVTKLIRTWPGYEHIAEKLLQNMGENFQRKFLPTLSKEGSKWRVIIHGDLWISNILMLETDAKLDAIFLDYQNSCEASLALDIINVFMTSAQLDVLKNHRQELIQYYHTVLTETLLALHYPKGNIPTLQDVLDEITRVEYFSYYVLMFPFAQTNLGKELSDTMDFNSFSNEKLLECNRANIYSNPRVVETYKLELKRLNELGILD